MPKPTSKQERERERQGWSGDFGKMFQEGKSEREITRVKEKEKE